MLLPAYKSLLLSNISQVASFLITRADKLDTSYTYAKQDTNILLLIASLS